MAYYTKFDNGQKRRRLHVPAAKRQQQLVAVLLLLQLLLPILASAAEFPPWVSVHMSLAVTTAGACSALPADFALTVAEAARRDAEQQPGVLLTRITRHTCQVVNVS